MPFIVVREKGGPERRIALTEDTFTIGKKATNDLILDRTAISREHCIILRHKGNYYVRDLDSRNGTYVNGRRIEGDVLLKNAAHIHLGDFRITFFMGEAEPAAVQPAPGIKKAAAARPAEPVKPVAAESSDSERLPVELKRKLHNEILERLDLKHTDLAQKSHEEVWAQAAAAAKAGLEKVRAEMPPWVQEDRLVKEVVDEAVGLGPIEDLLADPTVDEIMVNGWEKVYVERRGKIQLTNKQFIGDDQVLTVIRRILAPLGRRIDESQPMVDARLADGSRVNAIIHPLSLTGPTVTIRKFGRKRFGIDDLVRMGALSAPMAEFLKMCVANRRNMCVSGGTGSGKTTLLNVLSSFIPETERIVTIEDAAELRLDQEHVVRLESKPPNIEGKGDIPIRKLVINSLRMRPDRIIVGECRGAEALDMLQAMNTGHDGSLTTVHANTVRDSLSRLETMVMMAGMELPSRAIRTQIASAINIFVHVSRLPDGTRKIVHIAEMTGMESDTFVLQDIFAFKQTGFDGGGKVLGYHTATGQVPRFAEDLRARGIPIDLEMFQPTGASKETGAK